MEAEAPRHVSGRAGRECGKRMAVGRCDGDPSHEPRFGVVARWEDTLDGVGIIRGRSCVSSWRGAAPRRVPSRVVPVPRAGCRVRCFTCALARRGSSRPGRVLASRASDATRGGRGGAHASPHVSPSRGIGIKLIFYTRVSDRRAAHSEYRT